MQNFSGFPKFRPYETEGAAKNVGSFDRSLYASPLSANLESTWQGQGFTDGVEEYQGLRAVIPQADLGSVSMKNNTNSSGMEWAPSSGDWDRAYQGEYQEDEFEDDEEGEGFDDERYESEGERRVEVRDSNMRGMLCVSIYCEDDGNKCNI